MTQQARTNNPAIFRAACRIIAETDMIADLPALAVPTLVMTGEDNRTSPRMARAIAAAIPQAEVHIFNGLRHNLM